MVSNPGRPATPTASVAISRGLGIGPISPESCTPGGFIGGAPIIPTIEINEQRLLPAAPIVPRALRTRLARPAVWTDTTADPVILVRSPPRLRRLEDELWARMESAISVGVSDAGSQGSFESAAVTTATRGHVVRALELPPPDQQNCDVVTSRPGSPVFGFESPTAQTTSVHPTAQEDILPRRRADWVIVPGYSFEDMQRARHRLRRRLHPELYWNPPPDARVEWIMDPESISMRESLPSHAASMPVPLVPVYHTDRGIFDQAGRELLDPLRPDVDVLRGIGGAGNRTTQPAVPRREEVDDLPICTCVGCMRRVSIPVSAVDGTSRRSEGSPLEIRVPSPVETTVDPVSHATPHIDLAPDRPLAYSLVQQGYSTFFDPTIHAEDLDALATPPEPFFELQLPTRPVESCDMLDLVAASPNIRYMISCISPPYRGLDSPSSPPPPDSLHILGAMSRPEHDHFDICLLHNSGYHIELLANRDQAWKRVHFVRADFLEFLRLAIWRIHNGISSPTCESAAKILRAERQSHIDYKRDMNSLAVQQYLVAQRTLECFQDSRDIRDAEIAQLVLSEAKRDQATQWVATVQAAMQSPIIAESSGAAGSACAESRTEASQPTPGMSLVTPPAFVGPDRLVQTNESIESDVEPISPLDGDQAGTSLRHCLPDPDTYNLEYRFPRQYRFPAPTTTKEGSEPDNVGSKYMHVPLYPRVPEYSNASSFVESRGLGFESTSTHGPTPGAPPSPPQTPDGPTQQVLETIEQVGQASASNRPIQPCRPPLRGAANPRGVSYDAITAQDRERHGPSRAGNPFSRSVDFLLLSKAETAARDPNSSPNRSTHLTSPKITRLQSITQKLVGRKAATPVYVAGVQVDGDKTPEDRHASAQTHPVGTSRSLMFLRRSNASTLTLGTLNRTATPEPMAEEDAFTRLVREEAEKQRNMTPGQKAHRQWRTFKSGMKTKANTCRDKLDELKGRRS